MRIPLMGLILGVSVVTAAEPPPRAIPVAGEGVAAPLPPQGLVSPQRIEGPRLPETTRTESGQFVVLGKRDDLRSGIASTAEEVRRDFLRVLGQPDDQPEYPIVIQLHGEPQDPAPPRRVASGLFYLDGAFRPQLDVHVGGGVENERLRRATLEMLIYERALRNLEPGPLERPLIVRPWLVDGLLEAAAWAQNAGDRRLYERVFESGTMMELEELFGTREADLELMAGASKAAFRASAGAMVMALLEQPDGKEAFRAMIGEVAAFGGELPLLLRKRFPGLNLTANSLAKWWALQMANRSDPLLTDVLSVEETEAALERVLVLFERDADGQIVERDVSDHGFVAALKTQAERKAALEPAVDGLVRLSYRCFPSYRPVLAGYREALSLLYHGRNEEVPALLHRLAETRKTMTEKSARAGDYLDWFEITRARETSGVFNDYLEIKRQLEVESARPRTDPLGRYLDDLQAIYQRD